MDIFYVDGKFLPADEAVIPATDLSVLRGFGIFDFLRTYGGKPFHLTDHINRLERSSALIGIPVPLSLKAIEDLVLKTLEQNNNDESNIRIVLTGGISADGFTPEGKPRLLIMVTPVKVMPRAWYQDGAKIITIPYSRYMPGAKSINYIHAIHAMQKARERGAIEALYVTSEGYATECTTSNIFAFMGGKLATPATTILPGITRQVILDMPELSGEIEIRDIELVDLLKADEVFIVSSNKEVVPVVCINDGIIDDGKPGDMTRRVMKLFSEYTRQYAAK
ncbi:MAG: aminotransferase class IV [Deltaproteobacteria bacterium]|nr:aminotransferase class IV [Deltaproteobacteria bacterium]